MSDWKSKLLTSKFGAPKPLLANAITALREAPAWSCVLAYDEFARETIIRSAPPWDIKLQNWVSRARTSHDDLLFAEWLQREEISVNAAIAAQAVEVVAREASFHPVKEYLDNLEHDGTPRLEMWLSEYMGATSSPYHREVGRAILIAAVARIFDPGCKVDTVPIFEGVQGARKSTAVKTLFKPWFSDELADLGSKDAAMQTRGVWGLEVSELDAMSRTEVSRIKSFISRTIDRFRPPYGSRIIESPRTCVFWGTTNADGYLRMKQAGAASCQLGLERSGSNGSLRIATNYGPKRCLPIANGSHGGSPASRFRPTQNATSATATSEIPGRVSFGTSSISAPRWPFLKSSKRHCTSIGDAGVSKSKIGLRVACAHSSGSGCGLQVGQNASGGTADPG